MKKIASVTPEQFKSITEDKRALKRFVKRPQNAKIEAQWSDLSPGKLSSLEENAVYLLQEGKTSDGKGKEVKPTVLMVSRDQDGKKIAYQSEVGETFLQGVAKERLLDIEALVNREKVQDLIRQYAIGNKKEEKFPEIKMEKQVKDKNTLFFSVTSIDTNRNWGDGDLKGNINLETGRIKIYEREIDGENWSKNSWVLQKETNLQELIKGQDIALAFDYTKEMSQKYEAYLQSQKNENPEQTNTILDRIIAEQDYFTFKEDLVQEHGLSEEEVKRLERQVINAFHPGKEPTPEEKFKEAYKQQLQEALEEPQTEQTYKEQYKQEVLKQLGFSPSKEKPKEKEESKDKEKTTSGVQMKKETPEEREKRLQQMKEFESKQPFSKVYQLKKEVLKELKDLPLTDAQKAKLMHLEKALDQEKKVHDKEHSKETGIKKFFKGAREKKAAKKKRTEHELER
ncbi:hypothetical protein [Priestia endophytica]|uniref:Uncharacterized protein n=1 Tax=Priestia endophytica TaxID=135735 RepID=A0AAX1Q8C3_9BACI|nr:hypothetical protein [Priestia endophytica]RAS76679.1 hypothetical protein A3864_12725 [Priestia endophytica]